MTNRSGTSFERVASVSEEVLGAVRRLFPQLTTDPVPDADVLARVLDSGAVLVLARRDGEIVGMGIVVVTHVLSGTTAHVEDVVVDLDHRNRGVGEDLMNELIALARAEQANEVALTSHPSREAANRLYQRLGFELGGTNYYTLVV